MDKTTQGLKTLAEYMGEMPTTICDVHETQHLFYPPYNTSWDALVPVYAKVYKEIVNKYVSKNHIDLLEAYIVAQKNNNPQAAFEAVVELVNLINKENGK